MSKKCRNCGFEMADNMNFCPQCHAKFILPAKEEAPAPRYADECPPPPSNSVAQRPVLTGWQKMWQRRMTRRDFWTWQLISLVGGGTFGALTFGVGAIVSGLLELYAFYAHWPRLHDAGKSAWNLLWLLLPVIGWTVLLVLLCLPSEKGPNKWGDESQRLFGGDY